MAFWRRSMAEDAVDRYNHTWSVLLFIILSLTTWLLPLSPTPLTSSDRPNLPKYTVYCWCPAEFTSTYVTFTNQICATELNAVIRGEKGVDSVSLFYMPERFIPLDFTMRRILTNAKVKADIEENQSDIDFLTSTTPLLLFVLALCLKLPHIIWHLASGCTTLNVDRTLQAAAQGQSLSCQDRKQLSQELVQATEETIRSSPRSASLAYLLFKVLVCIVVVTEVVVVALAVLPRAPANQKEVTQANVSENGTATELSDRNNATAGFDITDFVCEFEIKQFQTVQTWSIQCLANEINQVGRDAPGTGTIPRMYRTVWSAILAYLLILLLVNVVSAATWFSKLFLGRSRTGLGLPMDVRLLLLMSRNNAGPLVTQSLVQHSSWLAGQSSGLELLSNSEKT